MERQALAARAEKGVAAQRRMLAFTSRDKRGILNAIADELEKNRDELLAVNAADVTDAIARGRSPGFLDRLTLTDHRVSNMIRAFRMLADLKDPIGEQISRWIRPNGLEIVRQRVPIGLVGVALESRPHVVALAAATCLKVNNAVMVVSDDEAARTNAVLARGIRDGGLALGLPPDAIQVVSSADNLRDCRILTSLEGLVDVVILRGSHSFVSDLVERAKVPVLKHRGGNCHVYVDCDRPKPGVDPDVPLTEANCNCIAVDKAVDVVINSRCFEPYACNSAGVVLVHRDIAGRFLPALRERAEADGVILHGDDSVRAWLPDVRPAEPGDWSMLRKDIILTIGLVDHVEAAIAHINGHGSHLADAIVSEDDATIRQFMREVDSATVYANAATCFTDGGEYGMGAEIGISTDKLNVRGPIGLEDLTTTKYLVLGSGQTRGGG